MICAIVMESVIVEYNFSAKEACSALAAISPAINPIIVANCFTNPFAMPIKAPKQVIAMNMISIVVILALEVRRWIILQFIFSLLCWVTIMFA